ncbi:MAG: bifunctional DNA primase/polymerase [Anaerolineae bacterium]|nr:bifunctional DNA primase/polymerase [Anaerolineae bacterium]
MAAERYLALGYCVIPLRGKVPTITWSTYQRRKPSLNELRRWARCGLLRNIGIVCGEVSGNLVVLDFDDLAVYETFIRRFPDLAQTYTVATGGGGRHAYLQAGLLPPSRRRQGVELRGNGLQVVAPPSVHPNSTPYQVLHSLDVLQVPNLEELARWVRPAAGPKPDISAPAAGANPSLTAAIALHFQALGYRRRGDWLNGPCIYPQRHAHDDSRISFGFNTCSGYGNCFRCGSMLAKDIARVLGIDPSSYGGIAPHSYRRDTDEQQFVCNPFT